MCQNPKIDFKSTGGMNEIELALRLQGFLHHSFVKIHVFINRPQGAGKRCYLPRRNYNHKINISRKTRPPPNNHSNSASDQIWNLQAMQNSSNISEKLFLFHKNVSSVMIARSDRSDSLA